MGCAHPKEIIESFNDDYKKITDSCTVLDQDNIVELRKGGLVVQTKIGNIQYGIPPETVKDSQNAGLTVPSVYIIPQNRFDRENSISAAEFEFPAYFNFFVLRKNITLVCDKNSEMAIRTIFQETLLGPKDLSRFNDEFTHDYPPSMIPDMVSELKHFAVNPYTKETLVFESIINIINYDKDGIAHIEDTVFVERKNGYITVIEDDMEIAKFRDKVNINAANYETFVTFFNEHDTKVKSERNVNTGDITHMTINDVPLGWEPPDFGVTFLGTGHGFDTKDATSGHIIWINGKGIMVDPPPFSTAGLKYYGISPNIIDKILISHCHADHDAGVLQKLLSGSRIELIATPTIMGSFIRKYASVANMTVTELQKLFEFRPITIGHPLEISGAKFRFFYSQHVIPCIGYECEFNGKHVFFSGDTYYDPVGQKGLRDKGVLRERRFDMLCSRDWGKYDVILHEAGVPPIHTPPKILQTLPDEVKKNMYIYHIANKDVPKEGDIKKALPGFDNTIVVLPNSGGESKVRNLELISNITLFREMPLRRLSDQQNCLKLASYNKGDTICKKGTVGWEFYIVKSGIIRVYNNNEGGGEATGINFEKYYYSGDFFGEAAITGDGLRQANVVAYTSCQLLTLTAYDFKWFFGPPSNNIIDVNTKIMNFMTNLNDLRKGQYAEFINHNKFVGKLTEQQKNDINACIKEYNVKSNETLWRKDDIDCKFCFFIYSGEFMQMGSQNAPGHEQKKAQFVGDFPNLITNKICVSTVKCTKNGLILKIDRRDFMDFVKKNPGLFVVLKDKLAID